MIEEVHLWCGSAEQRALRSQSAKSGQFAYFNQQLGSPDWSAKRVLDFGGNAGNLLLDSACAIPAHNYYCIDVLREAMEEGRRRFPEAHWIHYNRYNRSFNPDGIAGLPVPDLALEFDLILAYSVFTHTSRDEMHDLIRQLRARLAPGGVLAFTFIDPHWKSWPGTYEGGNLKWRLERAAEADPSVETNGLLEQSRDASWCALVDGKELFVEADGSWGDESRTCTSYNVFYTARFLEREFPGALIHPPANGEMQHCCIIRGEM